VIAYRDFYYPLNVFMHILTHEEGGASSLHYGLFERAEESIEAAQERSTSLLMSRLPPPPARLLDVGVGLGTTLARLTALGYDAEGITPDEKQAAVARASGAEDRPEPVLRVSVAKFETFDGPPPSRRLDRRRPAADRERDALGPAGEDAGGPMAYDVLLFQESSQYIDSDALFAKARALAPRVLVLDEFAMQPLAEEGALRPLDGFLRAAAANGFRLVEDLDLSAKAAPTVDYFRARLPRYRAALIADLGLTDAQIDDLIAGGERYANRYHDGVYAYRLLDLKR
jgi:hypothetical protein